MNSLTKIFLSGLFTLGIITSSLIYGNNFFPHYYDIVLINGKRENNFCIFIMPKTGSSTLRSLLSAKNITKFNLVKDNLDDYVKLLTVRDPLYRPISMYNEVMKLRKMAPEATRKTEFYKNRGDLIKSFKLFLHEVEDNFYEPHIHHQYLTLEWKNLTLDDMDFIFLFEELNSDMKKFCKLHQVPYKYTHIRVTPEQKKRTLINLIDSDPKVRQQIYKIWKKDFEFYEKAKIKREQILKDIEV